MTHLKPDISLPQWKQDRLRPSFVTSATQYETFDLCNRKWWLAKVRKLDAGFASGAQVFGTVLHSVIERYMKADDNGRDPSTGLAVDLYPPGWEVAESKFGQPSEGSVGLGDQELIKKLMIEAIKSGVVERLPGRTVESQFNMHVVEVPCWKCNASGLDELEVKDIACAPCNGEGFVQVRIMGFIDCVSDDTVQDHKTMKAIKWAQSKASLVENTQMLIYGNVLLARLKSKNAPLPAFITLRHNQFVKDPEDLRVRKTEVQVARETIEEWWKNWLVPKAEAMAKQRAFVERWNDIPDPANKSKACNAYGGCPYQPICAGRISEDDFEKLSKKTLSPTLDSAPAVSYGPPQKGVLLQRLKASSCEGAEMKQPASGETEKGLEMATPNTGRFSSKIAALAGAGATAVPGGVPVNPPAVSQQPPAAPAPVPQPVAVTPTAAPVTAAAAVQRFTFNIPEGSAMPPWANPQCAACAGKGFNTRGNPCSICDQMAAKQGRLQSKDFVIIPSGDGWFFWEERDAADAAVASPTAPAAPLAGQSPAPASSPVKSEVRVQAAPAAPTPAPAAPTPAPAAPTPAPAPTPDSDTEVGDISNIKGSVGRPKKGFILIYTPITRGEQKKSTSGGRGCHRLSEVLVRLAAEIAADTKVASYYDIDVFKRRDVFTRNAEMICNEFGQDFVDASGIGNGASDIKALLDAIRPYASMEIGFPGM